MAAVGSQLKSFECDKQRPDKLVDPFPKTTTICTSDFVISHEHREGAESSVTV